MTLRVAVDATALPAQRLGAGAYVTEVLSAIDDPSLDLHVYVNARDVADLAVQIPNATLHAARLGNRAVRIAWSHSMLAVRVRRLRPDVFHGPHYTLPPALACPSVMTFHDPTFFTLPELHEPAKVAYFTRAARAGIARASRVIAPSSYSARGAVEHAGADPDRVDIVPEGVDLARYRPGPAPERPPYILFVGALEPRKDVPTLIAAYDRLDVPHELVLTGLEAWGTDAVERAIAGARRRGSIRRTGFITEDEKIALYRGASVFVYPSIAEGFGLPVLEAMACGAPVVTTTGSAPEEFASGAAVLVAPRDADALRDAIASVLSDQEQMAAMREQGLERARGLSWAAAAAATVGVWWRATS